MAVSAPATAPTNPAAPAAAGPSKKRGRTAGAISWNEYEGLVAYRAYCYADEKQQSSSEAERFKNAKAYFDATIVQTQAWGMWDPPPVIGSKSPEQSMSLRTGAMIYARGKDLRKWLTKMTVGFQDMWHKLGEDGEDSYDFQPSGCNNAVDWWAECEDKVLQAVREAHKYIPVELKLTFRYVCPDSPYLSAEDAPLATDALPDAAREFFCGFGQTGDRRFFIDPRKRLDTSNRGASQRAQSLLARATSALGGDPRTPAGNLSMPPPQPQPAPGQSQVQAVALAMVRTSVLLERIAAARYGIDISDLPTTIEPAQAATAPLHGQTPLAAPPPLAAALQTPFGTAQGAAPGDPDGDADSAGLGADANRDGGDDSGDDSGDDGGDDGDGDNTPPSPPSPGEMRATQRRASTRARKAPRRSL